MWLDAIEADYKGGKVFSVPAPASGAMFISALGLLSTFEHEGEGSAIDLHRTTEAMKVSYGGLPVQVHSLSAACIRSANRTWRSRVRAPVEGEAEVLDERRGNQGKGKDDYG